MGNYLITMLHKGVMLLQLISKSHLPLLLNHMLKVELLKLQDCNNRPEYLVVQLLQNACEFSHSLNFRPCKPLSDFLYRSKPVSFFHIGTGN